MPITVACSCGKQLRVRDDLAGKRVKCPSCGGVVAIPRAAAAPAARPAAAAPAAAAAAAPKAPARATPACPGCGAPLASGAVLCVRCGFDTRTGRKLQALSKGPGPQPLDYDPDTMPRPYRTWRWVAVFFCLLWAAGALVGGVHVGFVTIHQGLPEQAAAKSWVLMKTFACFFGGGIVGAYLGGLIARFLPK